MTEILSSVEFQMSLLLFVALAGYLIASHINQSAVVGIILAGIAVGPSWLGLVTYTDFVSSLAHLGAVVLLFTVGLHFKLKEITNIKNFWIAFLGIIVPWIAGYYLAIYSGFDFGASIFIGTALTATSIAITANVLKEMDKLQTDTAKAIIGAAIIDDVLSLLALSISQEIVAGEISISLTVVTIIKAAGFLVIGNFFGKFLASNVITRLDKTRTVHKYPEFIFIFAMMVAFFYSMTAELIGLSAIVGSFLAGVSLEGIKLERGLSFREGAEYLQIIFASLFFVSLGVLVDLHELTMDLVWFLFLLTVVAILTKVIGCGIPARLYGMNLKDSLIVGFGMSPRGEVAMIIALIGLNQNLIKQDTYIVLILMSLLTTIFTPIVLRNWLYREKPG
ncbi:MAG: cation:proton antiporter [Euryarchaeota archaeon]|nr:cation:proton antiporter [Euryarchaeota archaeon]MCG2738378.1 cation:proton antiporter [Candidatus Methanoperedenaceae archaeon]